MRVATWNVCDRFSLCLDQLRSLEPDLAIVQEVADLIATGALPGSVPARSLRLAAVAAHAGALSSPDFVAGRWTTPSSGDANAPGVQYPQHSDASEAFLSTTRGVGWMKPFDWPAWSQTTEGMILLTQPGAIAGADERDLARIVTASAMVS